MASYSDSDSPTAITNNTAVPPNPFADFPPPNFINPETRAPLVIGINVTFVTLAAFFVVLRIWSRRVILGYLNPEDWLIAISWCLSFALSFMLSYATRTGLGRHVWDMPFEWFAPNQINGYVFTALYNPTLMFIKASIVSNYLRISPTKYFRAACFLVLAIIIAIGTSISLVLFFPCMPVHAAWSFVPDAMCINTLTVHLAGAILNAVTDFMVLLLPMPILKKVRLPRREKWALIGVFSMGIFVCIVSLVRIYLVQIANQSIDFTWVGSLSAMCSGVEVNVAIICASLPAIRPLVKRMFPGLLSRGSSKGVEEDDVLGNDMYRTSYMPSSRAFSMFLSPPPVPPKPHPSTFQNPPLRGFGTPNIAGIDTNSGQNIPLSTFQETAYNYGTPTRKPASFTGILPQSTTRNQWPKADQRMDSPQFESIDIARRVEYQLLKKSRDTMEAELSLVGTERSKAGVTRQSLS